MSSPIWHPFTQHALQPVMTPIARAQGAHLFTNQGQRIIDAISSWWVVTHGHCHPHLIDAAHQQAGKLDQVIFAGHTHEPAEKLAAALVEMTPNGLDKVFFSDSGSTSVEVALKMALGYWHHLGETQRNRIVVMEHSYHGDTVGTMSVGERGIFNKPYAALLFDVDTIPFPQAGHEHGTVEALERLLADHPEHIAALIVEPLVLGAGGMLMYSKDILRDLKRVCERNDIVFIADEVMTGWGRTGTLFACEQAGISPDILCTSKGLTGGFLPLAATLCHRRIFDAHLSEDRSKMFFHSSSYTANPIACAVGFANTELWRLEPVQARIDALAARQAAHLHMLKDHPGFENIRQQGTIAALDVKVADQGYLSNIGPKLYQHFQQRSVLLRPLGHTIYVLPPYCTSADDLDKIYDAIAAAPDALNL